MRRLVLFLGLLALCAGLAGGAASPARAAPTHVGVGVDVRQAPQAGGRWIHVDVSQLVAQAMEGGQVVYTAPITPGRSDWPTPTGTFEILSRVYSETMDSSTLGIPPFAPGGYHLTDVLYTQYFTTSGHALHYNYWSPRAAFGRTAGSHGCVGLLLDDAAYFWRFATTGTPVVITS